MLVYNTHSLSLVKMHSLSLPEIYNSSLKDQNQGASIYQRSFFMVIKLEHIFFESNKSSFTIVGFNMNVEVRLKVS